MKVASPLAVRNRLLSYSKQETFKPIGRGDQGAIVGEFHRALENAAVKTETVEVRRYLVWGFCFTPADKKFQLMKSSDLSDAQFFALKKWIGFFKNDEDEWDRRAAFKTEVQQILSLAETLKFLDQNGSNAPIGSFLDGLEETIYKVEPGGMVASAVEDMGGVITSKRGEKIDQPANIVIQQNEPEGGYIPL